MQMLYRLSYVGSGALVLELSALCRARGEPRRGPPRTPRHGKKKDELFPADFRHAKVGGKCLVTWNLRAPGRPCQSRIVGRWSGKRDSNPRPSAWKADALPLSYSRAGVQALLYGAAPKAQVPTRTSVCHIPADTYMIS